jgi:hypothetical protein
VQEIVPADLPPPPDSQFTAEELARFQKLAYIWAMIFIFLESETIRDATWEGSEKLRRPVEWQSNLHLEQLRRAYPQIRAVRLPLPDGYAELNKRVAKLKRMQRSSTRRYLPMKGAGSNVRELEAMIKVDILLEDLRALIRILAKDSDPIHQIAMRAGHILLQRYQEAEAARAGSAPSSPAP